MPTAEKAEVVEQTRQWYKESVGLIFADYRGLSVPQVQKLRSTLREKGAEFHVVKNTLFRLALGEDVAHFPEELHNGPTATAFIFREEPQCAKVLIQFAKDNKALEIKGGWIEGRVMSFAELEALSKLPGKQELIAMIVGLVAAPMSNIVGIMNEMIAGPIRAIGAIEEKAGGAPAAPAEEAPAAEAAPEAAAAEAPAEPSEEEAATEEPAPVEAEQDAETAQDETPAPEAEPTTEEQKEGQE